ncbi:MAG: DNA polymerase Y family protein [Coriobacteriales bacterium]|jgi:DNA polymerase-4
MRRSILHADMNCFYATVEQHRNPELRGLPIAVAGDPERRNGIILAKSREAKAYGVKTAEAIWQARQKCPSLILVPPDYAAYRRYSRLARMIYYDYTNQVEPFGLDESWLDITGSLELFGGDEMLVATEISERVKSELGLTVSVGVSWNKVFAKFGSDEDRGDGIVRITPENYRQVVWPYPVRELIYVGPATERKLRELGILTIGELATASERMLVHRLGKMGGVLRAFANGLDCSPVKVLDPCAGDTRREIKSIGNGLTAPHDIVDESSAKALVYLLAESLAQRLREEGFRCRVVAVSARDGGDLTFFGRQVTLRVPTSITEEIARTAFELLRANVPFGPSHPLRAIGVRACNLVPVEVPLQGDLFSDMERREGLERLDHAIDGLRNRFGNACVRRLAELADDTLTDLDIKRDNVVHPVGFFHGAAG